MQRMQRKALAYFFTQLTQATQEKYARNATDAADVVALRELRCMDTTGLRNQCT